MIWWFTVRDPLEEEAGALLEHLRDLAELQREWAERRWRMDDDYRQNLAKRSLEYAQKRHTILGRMGFPDPPSPA